MKEEELIEWEEDIQADNKDKYFGLQQGSLISIT